LKSRWRAWKLPGIQKILPHIFKLATVSSCPEKYFHEFSEFIYTPSAALSCGIIG
jgi:hypothetical protein